jgi:hypothetical protein
MLSFKTETPLVATGKRLNDMHDVGGSGFIPIFGLEVRTRRLRRRSHDLRAETKRMPGFCLQAVPNVWYNLGIRMVAEEERNRSKKDAKSNPTDCVSAKPMRIWGRGVDKQSQPPRKTEKRKTNPPIAINNCSK